MRLIFLIFLNASLGHIQLELDFIVLSFQAKILPQKHAMRKRHLLLSLVIPASSSLFSFSSISTSRASGG
jgi:hypothetical protein